MRKWVRLILITIILVGLDQWTKYLAIRSLKKGFVLIPDVFELQYVENQGAAFGILQNRILIFVAFTVIMLAVILYLYVKIPEEKGFGWIRLSAILIVAGAIGNLIDRVLRGYVVDFLYFSLIDFPVFNLADCFVVVGACLFILLYFVQKEKMNRIFSGNPKEKTDE